ncbi:MAG: M20/M25/M40 family metallo-hydrolase [Candidatus Brocadiia bacterium]
MQRVLGVVVFVALSAGLVSCQGKGIAPSGNAGVPAGAGIAGVATTAQPDLTSFNIIKNLKEVEGYLTSDELSGRIAGSPEGKQASDFLVRQFKRLNLQSFNTEKPFFQPFKAQVLKFFKDPQQVRTASPDLKAFSTQDANLQNVVGFLPGADGILKDEAVIIGAHYDHLGCDDQGGIYRGADDNASGIAALLSLAAQFTQSSPKPKRTIIFIAFDGEEQGLLGSAYYTLHPLWPLDKTAFMINLDTIGRPVDNKLFVSGSVSSPALKDTLNQENESAGLKLNLSYGEVPGGGDHISFLLSKVPTYFFFTGAHRDYHKVTDMVDKINFPGLVQVIQLVYCFARDVSNQSLRPEFKELPSSAIPPTAPNPNKKRVSLGMMPDFSGSDKGFLIGDVGQNSPAEKAGMKVGDIIVGMDDKTIKNLKDFSDFLNSRNPGDTVKITYLRGDKRYETQATFKERMMP